MGTKNKTTKKKNPPQPKGTIPNANGSTNPSPPKNPNNGLFPNEVVSNILSYLPVKSLMRSKSVCKNWRAIINSPRFAYVHHDRSRSRSGGCKIVYSYSDQDGHEHHFFSTSLAGGKAIHILSLPGTEQSNPCGLFLSESVHGMMCYCNGKELFMFNPSTGTKVSLPMPYSSLKKPYSVYGFGFNPKTKEYKILHVTGYLHPTEKSKLVNGQCKVLTVKTESEGKDENTFSWRSVENVPSYVFEGEGVCVYGAIHWIGAETSRDSVLVAFDLETETFRVGDFRVDGSLIRFPNSLKYIDGKLAMLRYDAKNRATYIYVVRNYQKLIWKKGDIVGLQKSSRGKKGIYIPIGTAEKGEMLLCSSGFSLEYNLVPCINSGEKMSTRTIRVSGIPKWADFYSGDEINFCITNHVESVMSIP